MAKGVARFSFTSRSLAQFVARTSLPSKENSQRSPSKVRLFHSAHVPLGHLAHAQCHSSGAMSEEDFRACALRSASLQHECSQRFYSGLWIIIMTLYKICFY